MESGQGVRKTNSQIPREPSLHSDGEGAGGEEIAHPQTPYSQRQIPPPNRHTLKLPIHRRKPANLVVPIPDRRRIPRGTVLNLQPTTHHPNVQKRHAIKRPNPNLRPRTRHRLQVIPKPRRRPTRPAIHPPDIPPKEPKSPSPAERKRKAPTKPQPPPALSEPARSQKIALPNSRVNPLSVPTDRGQG